MGLPGALWFHVVVAAVASAIAPNPHASHQVNCFQQPSRCGYPDASNTGVPSKASLQPSGSITVSDDGTTLEGLRVTGTVTVAANDVTIRDSVIRATSGGSGSYAIILNEGADGFRIEDSEVTGPNARDNALESAVWNHYGNPGASAVRTYMHGCADCWEGSGRFKDDYMVVDADYPESHNEDIYVCGGNVAVEHSTLVNRFEQTATVFGDTSGCGGNRFVVTDSLLAGGGYVLYPQANAGSPVGSMNISRNRFARCRTHARYEAQSGGTACAGGPDANGVFPNGGYFGVAAYYFTGQGQIWRENVWDDNLRPVCIHGSC